MADRHGHLDDKWQRPATPMADLERPRGNDADAGAGPLLRSHAASSPGPDQARPLRAARRRPARPGDPADYQKTPHGITQSSVVICDFGETKPIFFCTTLVCFASSSVASRACARKSGLSAAQPPREPTVRDNQDGNADQRHYDGAAIGTGTSRRCPLRACIQPNQLLTVRWTRLREVADLLQSTTSFSSATKSGSPAA